MSTEEQVVEQAVEYEDKARKTGWTNKDEFKGDPAKWIDAKSWVDRGEAFIPFLQSANRDLKGKLGTLEQENEAIRRQLNAVTKSMDEFKEENREGNLETAQQRKTDLIAAIAIAHKEDNIEQELQLRDQLSDLNDEIRELKKPKPPQQQQQVAGPPPVSPVMQRFLDDNPWFKDDMVMAAAATAMMGQLNASGRAAGMTEEQKFNYIATETKKRFGMDNPRRSSSDRVEGGRTGSGSGAGGGSTAEKSFEDMPPDARAHCDRISRKFIGKVNGQGQVRFKDLASYRTNYAKDYWDEAWGQKHLTQ